MWIQDTKASVATADDGEQSEMAQTLLMKWSLELWKENLTLLGSYLQQEIMKRL
jgi:hypothetical protein